MSRSAWIGVVALYVAAACVLTWPLPIELTTHLGALEGAGDPYLNLWILGWGLGAWSHDPVSVITGRVFDANIFFPTSATLTFSDHLLLQSLVLSPLYAISGNVVLCYNVLLLASIVASAVAMHALVQGLTGSTRAAIVAGLAWACWPYHTAHLLHLQLQSLYFLPLAVLAMHRLAAGGKMRDVAAVGVFGGLQAISSAYYGVMTAIVLMVSSVVLGVTSGQWRSRRYWTRVGAAALLAAVLVAPIALVYWRAQQREGFGRNLFEASAHSAVLQSYTQVPPDNLLYGRTGLLPLRPPLPGDRDRRHVEHQMFPGLVLLTLAALGLIRQWRTDLRPLVMTGLVLATVGFTLSLGPDGFRSLYAWIADWFFGFQAIRAPARFAVIGVLGLCLLAAAGVSRLRVPKATFAGLCLVVFGEYANAPLNFVAAPAASTSTGRWLREQPQAGAVLYLPLALDRENSTFMVQSLEHRRPIVNGYSGQRPGLFTAVVDSLTEPASVEGRSTIDELGVKYIVSPAVLAGAGTPDSPFVERARFDEGIVYEAVWTAASRAALVAPTGPPPPPAGEPAFTPREKALYEVEWVGGPLDLAAGTVSLEVAPVSGTASEARWALTLKAATATWVSRFFEANDELETTMDGSLRTLVHTRRIREGRRRLDRTFVYDRTDARVRIGESLESATSPSAAAMPLQADARDALATLAYVRSLALEDGASLRVPINDAGQSVTLDLTVGGRQTIGTVAGSFDTVKLTPRLSARVMRRQPIDATLWVTADRRHLPVLVDVAAGFGRLRLKLVDYRP